MSEDVAEYLQICKVHDDPNAWRGYGIVKEAVDKIFYHPWEDFEADFFGIREAEAFRPHEISNHPEGGRIVATIVQYMSMQGDPEEDLYAAVEGAIEAVCAMPISIMYELEALHEGLEEERELLRRMRKRVSV